jgi:hypothetical protein
VQRRLSFNSQRVCCLWLKCGVKIIRQCLSGKITGVTGVRMGRERWISSRSTLHKLAMFLVLLALFSLSKKGALLNWNGRDLAGFHSNCRKNLVHRSGACYCAICELHLNVAD